MELTIERAALLRALAAATSTVERNSKIPILRAVLLEAGDETLRLTGSDIAQECSAEAGAAVSTPGSLCLPAVHLQDFVKNLPTGAQVSIRAGDFEARVGSGRTYIKLPVLPAADFPRFVFGDEWKVLSISALALDGLFAATEKAVEPAGSPRQFLAGVFLEIAGAQITAVATDGKRLHVASAELAAAAEPLSLTIHIDSVKLIRSLIKDAGEVRVRISDRMIEIDTSAAIYRCKLIDGQFTRWRSMLFDTYGYTATVDRATINGALARVRSGLGTERPAIVLIPGEGELGIACYDPADGRIARDVVKVETTGAWPPLGTRFQHLVDAIDAAPGATITIAIAKEEPQRIRVHGDDPSVLALVAPYDALTAHDRVAMQGDEPISVAA